MQPDMRHLPASGALASCRRTSLSTPQQTGETGDYQGISDCGDKETAEGKITAAPGPLTHSEGELCVKSAQSSIKSTMPDGKIPVKTGSICRISCGSPPPPRCTHARTHADVDRCAKTAALYAHNLPSQVHVTKPQPVSLIHFL